MVSSPLFRLLHLGAALRDGSELKRLPARAFLLSLSLFFLSLSLPAQNDYFFPEGSTFDAAIPTPQEFLGYPIGDFHTRIDRMVAYMQRLAEVSDKAHFEVIGYTNEMRPQIVLTITTPENYANLETIREQHLAISDPTQTVDNLTEQPVIVLLGYNVHGNEPSSTEAAMLAAYYLVASTNPETATYLEESVIFVDPAFNPDGRDRHSHWANMHKAKQLVADSYDREHNEVWPGGRTNHYWFDLNRDWLPLAQVESRNRMDFYRKWLPNVVTDYHEMGTSSTYFFEPTEPYGSENPIVPRSNYDVLNTLFAKYYVEALDEIGSLYFTKEAFDNSYPGYGSTYPDIHGGLGMVFEQASSRGHLQESTTEEVAFAFTIRNHLRTSIATVQAAAENRETLLQHQRTFFADAKKQGQSAATQSYVFGDPHDWNRTRAFAQLLLDHGIETRQLANDVTLGGRTYPRGKAFAVPSDQAQYLMVKTFFEPVTEFHDSVFYDASSWTVALAFGMPHAKSARKVATGAVLGPEQLAPDRRAIAPAQYAYLIEWSDYLAPKALYHLLENEVNVSTAFQPFSATVDGGTAMDFGYGSLMIPVADQHVSAEELNRLVNEAANAANIPVYTVSSGFSVSGPDLGSRNFETVKLPEVVMLIGEGTSGYEAGEIWHLLDTRYGMPITKVDVIDFDRLPLDRYTTLIIPSTFGGELGKSQVDRIKAWTRDGGTLILQRTAVSWAIRNKLIEEKMVEEPKRDTLDPERYNFDTARERSGARQIGGVVFQADIDPTHPLGFGYRDRNLLVYRNHNVMVRPSQSPINTVVKLKDAPQVDGYVHPETLELVKGSASTLVSNVGRGKAILFIDNPNFRGFWYGTNRLFLNGLFFGGLF